MKLLLKWLICFAALIVGYYGFPGHVVSKAGLGALAAAATILWLLNLLLRPILQVLALPFSLVTFGLASVLVNAGMVALADAVIPTVSITGFWVHVLLAVLISLGNMALLKGRKME